MQAIILLSKTIKQHCEQDQMTKEAALNNQRFLECDTPLRKCYLIFWPAIDWLSELDSHIKFSNFSFATQTDEILSNVTNMQNIVLTIPCNMHVLINNKLIETTQSCYYITTMRLFLLACSMVIYIKNICGIY